RSKKEFKMGDLLAQVQPEDLLKFGLIPEFIGRLPVVATLHELNEEALFDMDGVKVKFTRGALTAVAKQALDRASGARGLRAILESAMLDIMYEIPSRTGIKEVV